MLHNAFTVGKKSEKPEHLQFICVTGNIVALRRCSSRGAKFAGKNCRPDEVRKIGAIVGGRGVGWLRSEGRQIELNQNYQVAGNCAAYRVHRRHVQVEKSACSEVQMVVQQFQGQMIADIVEMILVDHVGDFVQLNAGFLRVNPGLPTDVDDDNALVCGVDNEYDG